MTVTLAIDRTGGTPADVSVPKIAEADFMRLGTEMLPNGSRTTYTVATGDTTYPTKIVVQTKLDPNGNGGSGQKSATISIQTWARATDDVTGEVLVKPCNSMLAVNLPADLPVEVEDVLALIENVFSLTYATLSTKVPVTTRLSALMFQVSDVF